MYDYVNRTLIADRRPAFHHRQQKTESEPIKAELGVVRGAARVAHSPSIVVSSSAGA